MSAIVAGRVSSSIVWGIAALSLAACWPRNAETIARPMPDIPVYVISPADSSGVVVTPARSRDPIGELRATKLVSLTASNADARTLLLWLAQQAGVNLVVAPDVTARVSVSFTNVAAGDAMRAIIAEAGLSLIVAGLQTPWPPIVFFQAPVNINQASAESISARFGVSLEMARFIVESRDRP